MDLIKTLSEQLGINEQQASGGAGLLLKLARSKLGGDFEQLAGAIPDAESLIKAAPASGGLGALSGLLGKLGGGKLGNLAALAGGFSKLGLSSDMVGRFVPIVLKYVQEQDGAASELLARVLR